MRRHTRVQLPASKKTRALLAYLAVTARPHRRDQLCTMFWGVPDDARSWEHIWRVGDLVMWDNRCTMHRRDAFDPGSRRIMHRTQVKGEQRPA